MIEELKRLQEINAELVAIVQSMQLEIKELQDRTGITFDRWKETRKEQNLLYIQNRIEHHRSNGEGMMGAKVLACKDLKEQHQRILRTQ